VSAVQQKEFRQLETADRLLSAAEQILLEQGAHSMSIRRIATLSGVNSALISYHFGGLDALLQQLLERNVDAICDLRDEQLAAGAKVRGAAARLEALVRAYLDPLWLTRSVWHEHSARTVIREIMPLLADRQRRTAVTRINASVTATVAAIAPLTPHLSRDQLLVRLRLLAEAANIQLRPLAKMGLFPSPGIPQEQLDLRVHDELIRMALGSLRQRD
jgi:AcrR family transcriptional regulator